MRDLERELRELGERVRERAATAGPRPDTLRAVKRRRISTIMTAAATVVVLAIGSTYALGALGTHRSEVTPADGSRPTFARFFSAFSDDEVAVVEIDSEEGSICTGLTSLDGHESLTRIEIVTDLDDPQTLVAVRPNDEAFVPNRGGSECISGVEPATAQVVIDRPQDHFLLVESSDSRVRVSALTRGNGDGNHATGPHVTIADGRFLGVEWEYYGYESNDGLCLEFAWGNNSGGGCGFRPPPADYVLSLGGISHLREPGGAMVAEFDGQVSDVVKRLTVDIDDEEPAVLELLQPPERLSLEDRRFVHLIDTRKLDRNSRVWLIAYDADDQILERHEVRGLHAPERRDQVPAPDESEDFSAIWPEDTYERAREACEAAAQEDADQEEGGENVVSIRPDPDSVILEFGYEVLGWDAAVLSDVGSSEELIYELRRDHSVSDSGKSRAAVRVSPVEVIDGCWSVGSVSRIPEDSPKHAGSMTVRGRDVHMAFDTADAVSAIFQVGYGGKTSRHVRGRAHKDPVEFRLDFEPSGTGHFLVLLRDAEGEVFSAFGSPLPEGDFAAG